MGFGAQKILRGKKEKEMEFSFGTSQYEDSESEFARGLKSTKNEKTLPNAQRT